MNDILKNLIKQFIPFAQKHIGFEQPPRLFLRNDVKNASNPLGKTAFYDPNNMSITLYTTNRHPKDILRSLGHELVHHKQNCEGKFNEVGEMGEGYAQTNPHLRQMEIEANRDGSMCLRDFEDTLKQNNTIYFEHLQKGDSKMSTKDWKNGEMKSLLSEAWGFKMDLSKLNEEKELKNPDKADLDDDGKLSDYEKKRGAAIEKSMSGNNDENQKNEGAFDANHYCVHHGGVHHEGKLRMAEAIQHVKPDENGRITHYDMKLEDGTVLENVAVEDIQITNASLAEDHSMAKRDHKDMKDRPEDDELDEGGAALRQGNEDRLQARRDNADRIHEEDEEQLEEGHCTGKRDHKDLEEGESCPECGYRKQKVQEEFPGKRDMEQHKSDLSESRLKQIIAYALKTKV